MLDSYLVLGIKYYFLQLYKNNIKIILYEQKLCRSKKNIKKNARKLSYSEIYAGLNEV